MTSLASRTFYLFLKVLGARSVDPEELVLLENTPVFLKAMVMFSFLAEPPGRSPWNSG